MRLLKIVVTVYLLSFSFTKGADIATFELADWNTMIVRENWQVLFASQRSHSLGAFIHPRTKDLNVASSAAAAVDLGKCGVNLVKLDQTRFTSPFVPYLLTVSTPESRAMVPTLDAIMSANPSVDRILIAVAQPIWSRIMTSETTSALYRSSIWGNPAARAALIKCVTDASTALLVESTITANVSVRFLDVAQRPIDTTNLNIKADSESILQGYVVSDKSTFEAKGVTLARRRALCISDAIFFRNPVGEVGQETCH